MKHLAGPVGETRVVAATSVPTDTADPATADVERSPTDVLRALVAAVTLIGVLVFGLLFEESIVQFAAASVLLGYRGLRRAPDRRARRSVG